VDPDQLSELLGLLPDGVVCTSATGEIVWANEACGALVDETADAWVGRNILELIHPDDQANVVNALLSIVGKESGGLLRLRIVGRTGRIRHIEIRGRMLTVDGEDLILNVVRSVEDRNQLELAGQNPELLRALVHHSPSVLAFLDREARIVSASGALARLLGHDIDLVRGARFVDLVVPEERTTVAAALDGLDGPTGTIRSTITMSTTTDAVRVFEMQATDLRQDPTVEGIVVTLSDVTELKSAEAQLRTLASLDSLTTALNRRAFTTELNRALRTHPGDVALLFCDLDRFKQINDHHGHQVGDAVLVEVVRRLRSTVRGADLIGRIGGDEFVIALVGEAEEGRIATERRIHAAMTVPIVVDDLDLDLGISIGSVVAEVETSADALLATADRRMYDAKRRRRRTDVGVRSP
jgi:diguanylate cyclase (GGDEF)-like protein/PAS domain S-box-containing protein